MFVNTMIIFSFLNSQLSKLNNILTIYDIDKNELLFCYNTLNIISDCT